MRNHNKGCVLAMVMATSVFACGGGKNSSVPDTTDSDDPDTSVSQDEGIPAQHCAQLVIPDTIDFGMVKEPASKDIVLQNPGSCPLVIKSLQFRGHYNFILMAGGEEYPGNASDEKILMAAPVVIPPGSAAVWRVSYTLDWGKPAIATLVVFPEQGAYAGSGREIEIIANTMMPCIKVTPNPIDFGGKLIGQPARIDVEIQSCGTAPLEITDIFLQDGTDGTFQSSPDFQLDYSKLPAGVKPTNEEPMSVDVNDSVLFTVQCTPFEQSRMDPVTGKILKRIGVIQINNNSFDVDLEIETLCFGIPVECPLPVIVVEEGEEVPSQTTIHLHGEFSKPSSGAILSYKWTVDQPEENKFNLVPTSTFPSPTHQLNVSGTYTYCLDVCDDDTCSNDLVCGTTTCKKVYTTCPLSIHCELTWG